MHKGLYKLTFQHFIQNRLHLGHKAKNLNPKMNSYIFGIRHQIAIIDVEKIWLPLRYFYFNLVNMFSKRTSFFLLSTNKNLPMDYIIDNFLKEYSNINKETDLYINGYSTQKWVGGMLSNWNVIYQLIKYIKKLKKNNKQIPTHYRKYLYYLKGVEKKKLKPLLPDFVLVLHPNKEALNEIISLKIPFMGMVDSNTNPDNYLYHFFGNDDSLENIEFFFEFIKDALKEGRIKEQEYFFYLILSKIKTKLQERNNYLNIKNQVIKN